MFIATPSFVPVALLAAQEHLDHALPIPATPASLEPTYNPHLISLSVNAEMMNWSIEHTPCEARAAAPFSVNAACLGFPFFFVALPPVSSCCEMLRVTCSASVLFIKEEGWRLNGFCLRRTLRRPS